MDDLLGCGEMEKEKRIQEYRDKWASNSMDGKQEENITLLREALKEFPHDVGLMHDLCFSLEFSRKKEHLDECIEVGKELLRHPVTDEFYRSSTIQHIAFAYSGKNDTENAKKYAGLLPDFIHTKNKTLEHILEGEEKCRCAQENIMTCLHMIDNSVFLMLASGDYSPKERILARETVAKMYDLFLYDGNYLESPGFLGNLYQYLASDYAETGDASGTVAALKKAYALAMEEERLDDLLHSTSVFFDHAISESHCLSKAIRT